MRMLDLFSGIGGFAYAAKEVFGTDLEMVGFCDIDEYCFKVLEKNFIGLLMRVSMMLMLRMPGNSC